MPESTIPTRVIFRVLDGNNLYMYIGYITRSDDGTWWAIPTPEDAKANPRIASGLRLDPSLLSEQSDDVSEETYYIYRGVLPQ